MHDYVGACVFLCMGTCQCMKRLTSSLREARGVCVFVWAGGGGGGDRACVAAAQGIIMLCPLQISQHASSVSTKLIHHTGWTRPSVCVCVCVRVCVCVCVVRRLVKDISNYKEYAILRKIYCIYRPFQTHM